MGTFVLKRKLFGVVRVKNVEQVFGKGGLEKLLGGGVKTEEKVIRGVAPKPTATKPVTATRTSFEHEGNTYFYQNGKVYQRTPDYVKAPESNKTWTRKNAKFDAKGNLVNQGDVSRKYNDVATRNKNMQETMNGAKAGDTATFLRRKKNGKYKEVTVTAREGKGGGVVWGNNKKNTTQTPTNKTTNASTDTAKKPVGFFSNHPVLAGGAVVGGGIMAGSILQDHNDRSAY